MTCTAASSTDSSMRISSATSARRCFTTASR
jgi:hypothetical protein